VEEQILRPGEALPTKVIQWLVVRFGLCKVENPGQWTRRR
jgi:hypothetical protein